MSAIRDWLGEFGLAHYADAFEAEEIGPEDLSDLTHDMLKEIGVATLGHRLKILRAAATPDNGAPATKAEPPGPASQHLEPERRQLTILFCDLVGSTRISTRLDPEDYRDLIRSYHDCVAHVVAGHGGHVAKFVGDGILVYFGYPVAREDAAERALRAGLQAIAAVAALRTPPGISLATRIGISTGMVVVGDLTGRGVAETSVVTGEAPNLAAGLQGHAAPDTVVIAERTRRLVEGGFILMPMGARAIEGFEQPVNMWQVAGEAGAAVRFEAAHPNVFTPLVGRERELDQLLGHWAEARAGRGRVTLLRGDPGIGKSRLLQELADRVAGDEPVTLKYQCSEFFSNTAFHPIRRHMEHAARFLPNDTDETKLEKLITLIERTIGKFGADQAAALFAGLLSLPTDRFPPLRMSPALQKMRTVQAMIAHIEAIAGRRPVLIMFEDIHWADPTTLDTLGEMMERIDAVGVHLVITFRPEFEPPWPPSNHLELIDLRPLTADDIGQIVGRLLAGADVAPEVLQLIFQRTDGVPLFAEELTRSVMEGDDRNAGDAARFVPATLHDTLMARLDRLGSAREAAQLGAVLGREFDLNMLLAIGRMSEPALRVALGQLEDAGLITRVAHRGEEAWSFRHALIQDAAYESMLRQQRRDLHDRIARILIDRFPERTAREPEYVAHHLTLAGQAEDAARQWLLAGKLAWGRAAAREALAHLERGLSLLPEIADVATRDALELQLQSTIGVVHFAATSYASKPAQAAFLRARELCDHVGDLKARFAVIYGIGAFETMRGNIREGDATFAVLGDYARQIGEPRYEIYASSMYAWSGHNCGRFADSARNGARLLELYAEGAWSADGPRVSAADPRVISDAYHALSLWSLGRCQEARDIDAAGFEYAHATDDPYSLAYAYSNGTRLHELFEDWQTACDRANTAIAMAEEYGYGFLGTFAAFRMVRPIAMLGDPDKALEVSTSALVSMEAAGVCYNASLINAVHASLLSMCGRTDEALGLITGIDDVLETTGQLSCAAEVHLLAAEVLEAAGRSDDAEAAQRRAMDWAVRLDSPAWELRARLRLAEHLAQLNRTAEAAEALRPIIADTATAELTADLDRAHRLLAEVG